MAREGKTYKSAKGGHWIADEDELSVRVRMLPFKIKYKARVLRFVQRGTSSVH